MFLRLLRAVLSDGGSSGSLFLPESVPALVSFASQGAWPSSLRYSPLSPWKTPPTAPATCPSAARPQMALSEGVYYSLLCGDERHPRRIRRGSRGRSADWQPAYAEMFGRQPVRRRVLAMGGGHSGGPSETARRVGRARPGPRRRLRDVQPSRHDPRGARRVSEATFVVNPRYGHNVLVGACMGEIRLRWHEDFELNRSDLSCIDDRMPWKSDADFSGMRHLQAVELERDGQNRRKFQWLFATEYAAVVRATCTGAARPRGGRGDHPGCVRPAPPTLDQGARLRSPGAWVRRVAIRLAIRHARREQRRSRSHAGRPPPNPPDPASTRGGDDELLEAIRHLSPQQRAVVVLFYYEDRPMAEIAEILDCSPSTGWVHLHRARKRLASLLNEEVGSDVG